MFFLIDKVEQTTHQVNGISNPQTPGGPMVLGVFRTLMRTAFFKVYSKKAFAEYWDAHAKKQIARRHWTPEMKNFAAQQVSHSPRAPFIFKFTIVGWIFLLFLIGLFIYIIYDANKPPLPKSAATIAMEKTPVEGDVYFGRYEIYKEKSTPIGMKGGFGWFKIAKVEGDKYYISKSTGMSTTSKPKEEMNNTTFESETLPVVQLKELKSYNVRFKSEDGLTEINVTDKKTK